MAVLEIGRFVCDALDPLVVKHVGHGGDPTPKQAHVLAFFMTTRPQGEAVAVVGQPAAVRDPWRPSNSATPSAMRWGLSSSTSVAGPDPIPSVLVFLMAADPIFSKKGAHGTLRKYAIDYEVDPNQGAPFRSVSWAYSMEHALDKFESDEFAEGMRVIRIARMSEKIEARWSWHTVNHVIGS